METKSLFLVTKIECQICLQGKVTSPIHFLPFSLKEMFVKIFQASDKYSVQDGYLSGPSWGIRIDNDRSDDYVVAALVDLGRMPHREQVHWRCFNVLPPRNGLYSITTCSRWFDAIPTNCSVAPDLVFKKLYTQVNDKWRSEIWLVIVQRISS